MHRGSWCSVLLWPIMYINTTTPHLLPGVHHSLGKRGGIEKQSLFLLGPGSQSFIVSWDRAAPSARPSPPLAAAIRPWDVFMSCFVKQAGVNMGVWEGRGRGKFTLLNIHSCCFTLYTTDYFFWSNCFLPSDFLSTVSKSVKDLHFISFHAYF